MTCLLQKKTHCNCGTGDLKHWQDYIVGGQKAEEKLMPWMMRLSIVRSNGVFVCGGTLITSKHILTAAHCTHDAREESKTTFHTILTASNILNFTVNVIVKSL